MAYFYKRPIVSLNAKNIRAHFTDEGITFLKVVISNPLGCSQYLLDIARRDRSLDSCMTAELRDMEKDGYITIHTRKPNYFQSVKDIIPPIIISDELERIIKNEIRR